MAPEHDARTRAFYDHESDDTSPRRRRAAADWGVNEDIFDRMPSRRLKRPRAGHHDESDPPRFERRVSGSARPAEAWADGTPRGEDAWADEPIRQRRDDSTDEYERRQIALRRGHSPQHDDAYRADEQAAQRPDETRRETGEFAASRRDARRGTGEFAASRRDTRRGTGEVSSQVRGEAGEFSTPVRRETGAFPAQRRDETRHETSEFAAPRRRRPAESWTVTDDHVPVEDGKRSIDSWLTPDANQELALAPGESRTVVLETAAAAALEPAESLLDEPPVRRTVTITGHPDRLPAPRVQRPPKTALEHIGTRPDRIVGYAVLLGFVLVLIAVLTTGQ